MFRRKASAVLTVTVSKHRAFTVAQAIFCNDHAGRENLYFDYCEKKVIFCFSPFSIFKDKEKTYSSCYCKLKKLWNIWSWPVFPQHFPFSKTSIHTCTHFTHEDHAHAFRRRLKTTVLQSTHQPKLVTCTCIPFLRYSCILIIFVVVIICTVIMVVNITLNFRLCVYELCKVELHVYMELKYVVEEDFLINLK